MDIPKILYWFTFGCIVLCASYLIFLEYQVTGIIIILMLGYFHLIIFVVAVKDFIEIRSKIRGMILLVFEGIGVIWEAKLIIIFKMASMFIIIAALVIAFCNFSMKKLFREPKTLFKTFQ